MKHGNKESEGAAPETLPQTVTRRSFIKRTSGTVLAFGLLGATALAAPACPPATIESCIVVTPGKPDKPGIHLVIRNRTGAQCQTPDAILVDHNMDWFSPCRAVGS